MIIGKHSLLGRVEIRNENQPRYAQNLAIGLYEVTLNKAQIYVYLDWLKRGKIEVSDPQKEYDRVFGHSAVNVFLPLKDIRIEKS